VADLAVSAGAQKFHKTFTVEEPSVSEKIIFIRFDVAVVITKLVFLIKGASPNRTVIMRHGTDISVTGTAVITAGTVVTNTTTGQTVTTFDSASLSAGEYLWLTTTAGSGTVTELEVNVYAEEA